MTQQRSKREEFEELEQEIYDAVDEAFDEATDEVAGILKGYIGSPESKDNVNNSGEDYEYTRNSQ